MKHFTSRLIFQIGDLIHYQAHDYQQNTPVNASLYGLIGTLLKHLGKPNREHYTIEKLLNESSSLKHVLSNKLELIGTFKNFNAIMLVDLVSRMQGNLKDNNVEEEIIFIKNQYQVD